MPQVDPDDDDIARFVVWHRRYDPERRERRNVVIAAFDNHVEQHRFIEIYSAELGIRKAAGEAEAGEWVGGVALDPCHRRRQRHARRLRKAIKRSAKTGVGITEEEWADLIADLPSNVSVLRVERTEDEK
ncbi:MAG TPA: hypothetical protein VGL26_07580 [Jatrophihabitans sp.]|jgi:hypothetical protein